MGSAEGPAPSCVRRPRKKRAPDVDEVTFERGVVVGLPTLAISPEPDLESDSDSSVYSECSDELEAVLADGPPIGDNFLIAQILLKHGLNFDGLPLRTDQIFGNLLRASSYSPFLIGEKKQYGELEHTVLWDYFGGTSCLDLNVSALDTVMVVAEEFQVCALGALPPDETLHYLRLPEKWALGRWIPAESVRRLEPQFGLIPEKYLVSTKFYKDHPGLFINPMWYIGITTHQVAFNYLTSDRGALRPGSFCIFSPRGIMPDPRDFRPYVMLVVEESDSTRLKLMYEATSKYVQEDIFLSHGLRDKLFEKALQLRQQASTTPHEHMRQIYEKAKDPTADDGMIPENPDWDLSDDHPPTAQEFPLMEPFTVQAYTITRSAIGNYQLFNNTYSTLYDLVYHLSNHDSPLPFRLIYGAITEHQNRNFPVTEPLEQSSTVVFSTSNPVCLAKSRKTAIQLLGEREAVLKEQNAVLEKLKAKQPSSEPGSIFDCNVFIKGKHKMDRRRFLYDRNSSDSELGAGAFGSVYAGKFLLNEADIDKPDDQQKWVEAAFKPLPAVLSKEMERPQWVNEIEVLANLNHPNVVRLLGYAITDSEVELAFEKMTGNAEKLVQILMGKDGNGRLSCNEQTDFLQQIARGMSYLHSLTPAIVHGDLALRNVLYAPHPTDPGRYRLKITDFGLSKITCHDYATRYQNPDKIPFKYCAPEAWQTRELSVKSDVWMFGITANELYGACVPYGFSLNDLTILPRLQEGYRHCKPDGMPYFIYEIVLKCFRKRQVDRPTFCEIVEMLEPHYLDWETTHVETLLRRERPKATRK
ncbi:unnamed protein product, partial [Mesorhabditis spiculigera]